METWGIVNATLVRKTPLAYETGRKSTSTQVLRQGESSKKPLTEKSKGREKGMLREGEDHLIPDTNKGKRKPAPE